MNVSPQWHITARFAAAVTIVSLLLSAFPVAFFVANAASTGITLDKATETTPVSVQANFVVSVTKTGAPTDGTYIALSDGGNGGDFFDGTTGGQCNSVTPDTDDAFAITNNKGVCYSNATPGVYVITVQLQTSNGGDSIGDAKTIQITVTDEEDEEEKKVDICHWNGSVFQLLNVSVSSIGNAHGAEGVNDGDIIPAFGEYPGQNLTETYNGKTGSEILLADCVVPPSTGTITIDKIAGGDVTSEFDFTGGLGAFTIKQGTGYTADELKPGEYTITETATSGWELLDITCNDVQMNGDIPSVTIDLEAGDDVTCIFTNRPTQDETIYGCMDEAADNYNPNATQQGNEVCVYPPVRCENLLTNGSFEEPLVTNNSLWQKFANVVGWVIEKVSDDSPTTLEVHRGWSGNDAAEGEQYAELDGDHSTKISQTVSTIPGAVYELKWAFAPRHNITAEQNQLSVLLNDTEVATEGPATGSAGLEVGDWTLSSYEFIADSDETTLTFSDAGPSNTYGTFLDDAQLCLIREPQLCEPEEHVFADNAVEDSQGLTKNGNDVAPGRSNPEDATGEPDWTAGGSTGFYSLGFGGSIVVSFDKYVVNVNGDDLSIHEATNGNYPLEKATVEVSQNGSTWYQLSELARNDSNEGGDGVTLLDFDETGLAWIKFVRITDVSDPSIHSATADGFDLDAVDATYVVCDEPEQQDEWVVISGQKFNDLNQDGDWTEDEPLLSGVEICLENLDTEDVMCKVTNELGYYIFADLEGGVDYEVTEVVESPWVQTAPETGSCVFEDTEEGVEYYCDFGNYSPVPEVPYCGDGEINQEWEMCEIGDEGCTNYCTLDNQCSALKLGKVEFTQAPESYSFDQTVLLGAEGFEYPAGYWFNLDDVQNGDVHDLAKDTGALVISNDGSELTFGVWGGNASTKFDYVFANIHFLGVNLGAVNDSNAVVGWPLEDGGKWPDTFDVDGGELIEMEWYLTTGGDAASVAFGEGEEYDCPECKAEVEARVVIRDEDGAEIAVNGDGNLLPQVILGDGSTVPFGEWFKISEAPAPSSSAVWIDDAETVTNFTNPADLEGLFVSREGNGQVKVALYGFHNPGGDVNYESLRATIEFNDAEVAGAQEIPGDFKLENHSEGDNVNSNDFFDSFAVHTNSVDFDFWVDTKADGITITLDEESIASCDDDSDPEDPEDDTIRISGYKYQVTDNGTTTYTGWNIYADNLGEAITLATTTDENGYYYFDVEPGDWEITEEVLYDWEQVRVEQDGEQIIGDGPGSNVEYCSFDIPEEESNYTCDFYNAYEEEMYLIDGYKYEIGDDYQVEVAGWEIELYDDEGLVMSTSTDVNGYYYFYVPAGEYEVVEVMQSDWEQYGIDDGGYYYETVEGPLSCSFAFPLEDEYPVFNSISYFIQGEYFNYSDYRCTFYNMRTDDGDDEDDDRSSSRSSGTRTGGRPAPQVLGESVSQCEFLKEYMQMGVENNSFEVTKLQMFLKIVMGYEQPITGFFGATTDANVKKFQEQYAEEILNPWYFKGIVPHYKPTGFVYKLTKWKINDIVCPGWDPYPSFDGESLSHDVDIDATPVAD